MSAKRLAGCVAIILAVVVAVLLMRHPQSPAVRSEGAATVASAAAPARGTRIFIAPQSASATPEELDLEGGPPVIERVSVDKTEVCRGEDNFATISAHTPDGADYYLRVGMTVPDGRFLQGSRIPFTLDRQPTQPIRVSVEGRRRASFAELPEITVKDCDAPRRVNVTTRRSFDASDRVQFSVSVVDAPRPGSLDSAPFEAVKYEWDFGDGQKQTTTAPQVMHSYEGRSQASVVSVFLVRVRLLERGDRSIEGAVTVPLTNRGFVPLTHENTVLVSAGVQRMDGSDEPEKIWLYHGYSSTVSIDRVEIVEGGSEGAEPTRRELSAPAVLGFSSLAAGESRELPKLDAALTRAGQERVLVITGHTDDGKAAIGRIALTGAPAPTASTELSTDDGRAPGDDLRIESDKGQGR